MPTAVAVLVRDRHCHCDDSVQTTLCMTTHAEYTTREHGRRHKTLQAVFPRARSRCDDDDRNHPTRRAHPQNLLIQSWDAQDCPQFMHLDAHEYHAHASGAVMTVTLRRRGDKPPTAPALFWPGHPFTGCRCP